METRNSGDFGFPSFSLETPPRQVALLNILRISRWSVQGRTLWQVFKEVSSKAKLSRTQILS